MLSGVNATWINFQLYLANRCAKLRFSEENDPGPIKGAFQIVASLCFMWAVKTPPTADAPVGVSTNRRQFGIHPAIMKMHFMLPFYIVEKKSR